jgi:hypothetical protein
MTRDLQLPTDVITNRYGRDGQLVVEYDVVGPNLVVWCKCIDKETAELISWLLNKQPRESVGSR